MYLKEISYINYKSSDFPILFEDLQTDRVFGIISNNKHSFKFGWQSTIIKPVVKEISKQIYAIGIDQNFVIIDLNLVKSRLKLKLNYFFYDMVTKENFIIVITELEIFIISELTYKVVKEISLPEVYTKMDINGQSIKFICIDGSEVDFNLSEI